MKQPALWATHLGTQTTESNGSAAPSPNLQRMLASVVVSHWADVMPDLEKGMVDVEYRLARDRSIEYLRLWASSRWGFSDLICQYSRFWHWSNTMEVSFGSGYQSKPLAEALDYVVRNASNFSDTSETANGLVQVYPSTEAQKESADEFIAATRRQFIH
jgi:hypothetical protein